MSHPPNHLQQIIPVDELLQAGLELLAELDLKELLQKIVRLVADMLQTDIGGLYLCQPEQDRLQIAATINQRRPRADIELVRGEGLAGKVWQQGEPLIVEDYAKWEGHAPHLVPVIQHRALAGFPIQRTGDMLGVLLVAAPPGQKFTAAQIQLLRILAAQAAVAIENARLFETWQSEKELAESLQEVALILNSGLEMRPLLIRILQQLRRVIPYDSAGIFLREGNDLVHYGSSILGQAEEGNFARQPYDDPTYFPLYTRQPYLVADVRQEAKWHLAWDWEQVPRIRSWMAVPLLEEDDVIGVITADSFTVDAYSERAVQIAQSFVNQAVVAIRNARLYKEAHQAREAAESANRAKSQFLATLSHELRTPLSGVLGYTQLLKKDKGLNERQQRQVSTIEQSGQYLLTLINDLLDLAKIESGRFELSLGAFELTPFLQTIGGMIRVQAEEKGLTFVMQAHGLPTAVIGDEKRLRQVLVNLLGNAVKFTAHGQVMLQIQRTGPFPANSAPIWLQFTVEDTGIGIDPGYLHRIFEPFQQLGEAQQRAEGTGLGLAISHSLIELMGGQLEVSSEVGKGSKFAFTVPMHGVEGETEDAEVTYRTPIEAGHPEAISPGDIPPLTELTRLYAQTLQGDIAAIRHTVTYLTQTFPHCQPFLQDVEYLAQTFQVNELKRVLATVMFR